ncbi:MAG: hypothetical protein ACTXOO_01260 [Sodalis sp. (in: enterobacteria)]
MQRQIPLKPRQRGRVANVNGQLRHHLSLLETNQDGQTSTKGHSKQGTDTRHFFAGLIEHFAADSRRVTLDHDA